MSRVFHSAITDPTTNAFLDACAHGDVSALKKFWSRRTRPKRFDRHMYKNLCLVKAVAAGPTNIDMVERLLKWGIHTSSRDYYAVQVASRHLLDAKTETELEEWFGLLACLLKISGVDAVKAGNSLPLRMLMHCGMVHHLARLGEPFENPQKLIDPNLATYALACAMAHAPTSSEHRAWLTSVQNQFPLATFESLDWPVWSPSDCA